ELRPRLGAESRNAHDTANPHPARGDGGLGEGRELGLRHSPALRVIGEVDLDEAIGDLSVLLVRACERVEDALPVDGVDDRGESAHRADLLALKLPDEMPREVKVAGLRRLDLGLLLSVLTDVTH